MRKFKFLTGEDKTFEEMMHALHELDELAVRVTGIDHFLGGQREVPRYWVMANGTGIEITALTIDHIENILNCLNDRGAMRIPDIYEGYTKSEWIEIMMDELNRRNNEGL